ncbi:uncharacterized protein LOC132748336 [Ruditapes philippinarum]|uniref:uncharacterized protein LOC132748336 n=1 Tax=Ruditapes philippinarum TaxID=129788 RepID=UPI00295BDB45|nr:uncharacterized protein LOC132748336 [Ruditapes philippinarum]
MAKDIRQNIAKSLKSCQDRYGKVREKFQSPFFCMLTQVEDMKSLTTITLNSIEPEFSYLEYLQPSRTRPDYWNNLGSSKSRTVKQEDDARQHISSLLSDVDTKTAVAFTDGSCRGNPGPCGAGACILLPNTEVIELKQPVSKLSSILVGELVAIKFKITLQALLTEIGRFEINKVKLLSDSQSAVGIIDLGWENKTHKVLSTEILQLRKELELADVTVNFDWTPGHAGIKGNDLADRLAKEAAKEAEEMETEDSLFVTSQSDIRHSARESVRIKWQRRWEIVETGRHLYGLKPQVQPKKINFHGLSNQRQLLQLQSGYCLNDYLNKIGAKNTSLCNCGEVETVTHFIEDCTLYETSRENLKKEIFLKTGISVFTKELLLSDIQEDQFKDHRQELSNIANEFVKSSKRF